MKYKVNDDVRVITTDTCGFGCGYIGKVTAVYGDNYEVDGACEYCDEELEFIAPRRTRGFQRIKGFEDIPLPTRATKYSAGYDLASAIDITIIPDAAVVIPTGLKAYMLPNEFLGLYVRSSIGKQGLAMVTGVSVIDSDYYENQDNDGHIFVMLRNDSSFTIEITKGTRLVQGIFHSYLCTDDDKCTNVRNGGIGSTNI